jgi:hypothetical protein
MTVDVMPSWSEVEVLFLLPSQAGPIREPLEYRHESFMLAKDGTLHDSPKVYEQESFSQATGIILQGVLP